ncbi:MAG: TolB family protein [Gammaproteobacteria bacterium]
MHTRTHFLHNLKHPQLFLVLSSIILLLNSCGIIDGPKERNVRKAQLYYGEDHLTKVKQLTFTGENARASFSPDNKDIIFQSTRDSLRCDAVFRMRSDGTEVNQLSTGKGVAAYAVFSPDTKSIMYSSTQKIDYQCPVKPEYSKDYTWLLYSAYDIYIDDPIGGNSERITKSDVYDGDVTYSPTGDKVIFSSNRSGDMELYIMNIDGSSVKQLTHADGFDGDASFSHDGNTIVWRASRPKGNKLHDYRYQLSQGVIRGGNYEIFMMKLNGGKPIQLTRNGATNFSPSFDPKSNKIIFSSNMSQKDGRNYDIYILDIKTRKQERITYYSGFDGYPVFSSDGKKLLFTSSRNFRYKAEKNIFIVDWDAAGIYTR